MKIVDFIHLKVITACVLIPSAPNVFTNNKAILIFLQNYGNLHWYGASVCLITRIDSIRFEISIQGQNNCQCF